KWFIEQARQPMRSVAGGKDVPGAADTDEEAVAVSDSRQVGVGALALCLPTGAIGRGDDRAAFARGHETTVAVRDGEQVLRLRPRIASHPAAEGPSRQHVEHGYGTGQRANEIAGDEGVIAGV